MESVAKETDVPIARLEEIQRLHRSILAALEPLISSMPEMTGGRQAGTFALACMPREHGVRQQLLKMARALRFGRVSLLYGGNDASLQAPDICDDTGARDDGRHALARDALLRAGRTAAFAADGSGAAMEHRGRAAALSLMAQDDMDAASSSSRCTTLTSHGTPKWSLSIPKPCMK